MSTLVELDPAAQLILSGIPFFIFVISEVLAVFIIRDTYYDPNPQDLIAGCLYMGMAGMMIGCSGRWILN